jgi:hypothetical protein
MDMKNTTPTAAELIRAAVAAAGRPVKVGPALGCSAQAVSQWCIAGRVPLDRIIPLCELQRVVTSDQILDAMAREAAEKAAA